MSYTCVSCPICEIQLHDLLACDMRYAQCPNCKLIIQVSLPLDPSALYGQEAYDKHRIAVSNQPGCWARFQHDQTVALSRVDQLKYVIDFDSLKRGNSQWLDYGCCNAALLCVLRRKGIYNTLGVELDYKLASTIVANVGIKAITANEFYTYQYNQELSFAGLQKTIAPTVISAFDVIEHLIDPFAFLLRAKHLLYSGGYLVIEVPDADQTTAFNTWKHNRYDEHLYAFSKTTLERIRLKYFEDFLNLQCIEPVPGKVQVVWYKKGVTNGIISK